MKFHHLLFLSLLALVAVSCNESSTTKDPIHSVLTLTPSAAGSESLKSFTGVVKENAEVSVGFKTPGQIVQLYAREGDYVYKGQLLARLDDKDYKLGVEAVSIQYKQLKDEVARLHKLYVGKGISGNDYEKAVSGLEQLGVQLQSNRNKLSYTRLYAPQSGYIKNRNFEPAEMVNAGTSVFTLLDNSRQEVELSIPVEMYNQRSHFGSIYAVINGRRYNMQIISIIPQADNNQLYTVKLACGSHLPSGVNADVYIPVIGGSAVGKTGTTETLSKNSQHLVLPQHAIFEKDGKTCVWVVRRDSTVSLRPIITGGMDDEGNIIVVSGLNGSETIVKAGVEVLTDNEKVKVLPKTSKTNVGGLL